jgi:hypothetical protein
MASVAAVRAALATQMTGISALTTAFNGPYYVAAYPTSNPTPPQIEIGRFSLERHAAMLDGVEWWRCSIEAYVAITTDALSWQTADAFLANDPISAAIESNRTLGGLVSDLIVDRADQRAWKHPALQADLAGVEYQLRILV